MNSAVLAVLGAIAAILATIGFILFGKPKGEDVRSGQAVERVQNNASTNGSTNASAVDAAIATTVRTELPVSELVVAAEPVISELGDSEVLSESLPESLSESLPEQADGELGGITLDSVEQPDAIDLNEAYSYDSIPEASIELNFDNATQSNELMSGAGVEASVQAEASTPTSDLSQFAEPLVARRADPVPPMGVASRYSVNNPPIQHAPYSVLNDSKRPKSLASQKLSQQLLTWGKSSEQASQVISYAQNQDPIIRKYVAQSLTIMLAQSSDRSALSTVISTLETLSHDADPGVKSIAQSALGV